MQYLRTVFSANSTNQPGILVLPPGLQCGHSQFVRIVKHDLVPILLQLWLRSFAGLCKISCYHVWGYKQPSDRIVTQCRGDLPLFTIDRINSSWPTQIPEGSDP